MPISRNAGYACGAHALPGWPYATGVAPRMRATSRAPCPSRRRNSARPSSHPACCKIHGNGRLLTVRVRVIADVVTRERGNDVASAAALEHARLLADDLERGPDPERRQHLRQTLRRVIVLRQEVVLDVEPERHVDRRHAVLRRDRAGEGEHDEH